MSLTCMDCGAEFEKAPKGPPALRCVPCKQERNRELQRTLYPKKGPRPKITIEKVKSIPKVRVPCGWVAKAGNGDRCENWECGNWMKCLTIAVKKRWAGFKKGES